MPIDIENDTLDTALKKLKSRENILREIEELSGLGSWEIDYKTKKSHWSKRSYEIYGIPEGTPVSLDTFFDLLSPANKVIAQEKLKEALQTEGILSLQIDTHKADGTPITVLVRGEVIRDQDGNPLKFLGTTQDITDIVKLKQEAKELSELLEHSSNEIYIVDTQTLNYLYVNKGACDALGYTKKELLTKNIRDINPYLTQKKIEELKKELLRANHIVNRTIHQRKDGSTYSVQSYLHTIEYHQHQAFVIFDTDISEIVSLEQQHEKQAKILEHIHDAVISTDIYGNIKSWNTGSTKLFGYNAQKIKGKNAKAIFSPKNNQTLADIFSHLNQQHHFSTELTMLTKENKEIVCNASLSILRDKVGHIEGYIGYFQDKTEEKKTQLLLEKQREQLHHQAHHDALTQLPNRTLFQEHLQSEINTAKRFERTFALLFIDLDNFKKINDSMGHHIGDQVLVEATKRLKSVLRENDILSRLGGDEFTVILKEIKTEKNAATAAQKLLNSMKKPMQLLGKKMYISASIGIALFPNDATQSEDLIKYADVAMYKAKDEGRNTYKFYSDEMTHNALQKIMLENELREAIKNEDFCVYYQPQYDATTNTINGMEALVRWIHEREGIISPGEFIPLAEENGLIIEIDRIVMKKAMKQFAQWYKEGFNPGILALNLSMRQLNDNHFITHLLKTMKACDFQASWLELEVTEGEMMRNPQQSAKKLRRLSEMGIEIAIDDFGTGYSSLSYLKRLPLTKLKIDQSFVRDIPDDEDDVAITKAIIALGKSLNLKLIAEGVETQEQRDFMLANECPNIQGYFYSKPLPPKEMTTLLKR